MRHRPGRFLFQCRLPGSPRSYTDSTGGKGQPGPQDVLRCVEVPVVRDTASGTGPRTDPQRLGPARCSHAEHTCDDGYHGSTLTTWRPYRAALYSSMAVNWPNPASWTLLASLERPIPATLRVSTHTLWCSRTRRVES